MPHQPMQPLFDLKINVCRWKSCGYLSGPNKKVNFTFDINERYIFVSNPAVCLQSGCSNKRHSFFFSVLLNKNKLFTKKSFYCSISINSSSSEQCIDCDVYSSSDVHEDETVNVLRYLSFSSLCNSA